MNYEQKYKEALEKARQFSENPLEEDSSSIVEYIFPELKESEDEKIRKYLLKLADRCPEDSIDFMREVKKGDIIAWLEKQGGITKLSEEEQNRFAKGVLSSCALSFIDYLDTHRYKDKMCLSNGECEDIENAFHNAMWDRLHRYYCKYIEKQGEQKETICDKCKKEQPSHSCQDITSLGRCALEKQGERIKLLLNKKGENVQDLIEKYVSDHAANRWLDASELEQLLNDFVVEYDKIKNREYEQQCKVSNDGKNRII